MPLIMLHGDKTLGHGPGCWGPATVNAITCTNVKINNKAPVVLGDTFSTHQNPANCGNQPTHTPAIVAGRMSRSIFINGKPVLRDSDLLSCGDSMNSEGGSVLCEDIGGGPVGPGGTSPNFIIGKPIIESFLPVVYRLLIQYVSNPPYYIPTIQYLNWCNQPNTFSGLAYTPITDDSTNIVYKNYPSIGVTNLPSYAPEYLRDPIPINFSITNSHLIPQGITFNSNGVFTGLPTIVGPIQSNTNQPINLTVIVTNGYTLGSTPNGSTVQMYSVNTTSC